MRPPTRRFAILRASSSVPAVVRTIRLSVMINQPSAIRSWPANLSRESSTLPWGAETYARRSSLPHRVGERWWRRVYVRQCVAGGMARHVASQKPRGARVIVGRDPPFPGKTFLRDGGGDSGGSWNCAGSCGRTRTHSGIRLRLVHAQNRRVINFTASYNPPQYNRIKFSTPEGCPALPEVTKKVEGEIEAGDCEASASPPKTAGNGTRYVTKLVPTAGNGRTSA
jgi:hypothetical protein